LRQIVSKEWHMTVAADFGVGDVFLSMLWFFLFFLWIWLLIAVFAHIFRSEDLSGWGKALWTVFVIVLPYIGVLVYLIVRGSAMGEDQRRHAQAHEKAMREYVQSAAGTGGGASEISQLAALRDKGIITDAEFEQAKAKILS
jgi:hypothetical protein